MTQDSHKGLGGLGILAGGGPAPGINAVIAAATIRTRLEGLPVHGLLNGFAGLMAGDSDAIRSLEIDDVSRMHYRGGSMLGIARANPTRREEDLDRVIAGLESKGIDKLITIGGDDTALLPDRFDTRCGQQPWWWWWWAAGAAPLHWQARQV